MAVIDDVAVAGEVVAVVVGGAEADDGQCAVGKARVGIRDEFADCKGVALDGDIGVFVECGEDQGAAVGRGDESQGVCAEGAGVGFEVAGEEVVE